MNTDSKPGTFYLEVYLNQFLQLSDRKFDNAILGVQNIRQWFNEPVNPAARETVNAVGCPHKRTKYRPARGVVSAEIGIGNERIFRIFVVF